MVTSQPTSSGYALTNAFGIYVHFPFCVHKCSYCDFYSITKYQADDFETVTQALKTEIQEASRWIRLQGKKTVSVTSLFFGGGTPSLFPVRCLQQIFECVFQCFSVSPEAEITVEANPETVTSDFCETLGEKTPVNRVSLGAQSFNAKHLALLERLGSKESIQKAAGLLADYGFRNFNLDLIFAVPGQTMGDVISDIEEAVSLRPTHISFYNLTLKPGHALYSSLPKDESAADFYENGIVRLDSLGYEQYEISNFCKPGFESRHNLLYWAGCDFLGVGPSAASRFFWDGRFHHRKQVTDLNNYLSDVSFPHPGFEQSTREQTLLEATFLEMRKNSGIHLTDFNERYQYDLTQSKNYSLYLTEGLIEKAGSSLRLTPRGRLLADAVTRDLVDF